ncbi:MAG: hypothetical protein PHQ28_12860 [Mycobacterium sp.]|nr:hypothetical protein [Mycobacterium sp.]
MTDNEIAIGGENFALVADSLLPKGKRALQRSYFATNAGGPTIPGLDRVRLVPWDIWGPIGASRESTAGRLGTDFARNLETRWPERLISAAALVTVPIDLPQFDSGSGLFDTFVFDDPNVKFGGKAASGLDPDGSAAVVRFFDEQQDSIFAHSANISSQVDSIAGDVWTPSGFHAHGDNVQGAVSWYGKGRITLGNGDLVQTRDAVLPGGSFYTPVHDFAGKPIRGGAEAVGSDRLWMVDDDHADSNLVFFTLDALQNFSAPFQVGDAHVPANGIGPYGPKTFFGTATNNYSFTDQAKPVPLSRALIGHHSRQNGSQWADPGFGWNYCITNIGLRAMSGSEDNPVGIGEQMREFTGHNGVPTAIWSERGELWIAYLTSDGDTYIYRGDFGQPNQFGSSRTARSGQPDLFPAHFFEGVPCYAIGSTNTPPNTEVMYGYTSGSFLREVIDRNGRDDLFPARRYGLTGGTWYGTLCDRDPNLLKTLRCVRIRVRNVNPCASWSVWVSFNYDVRNNVDDSDVIWQQVGPALTEDGYYTLYPISGDMPLAAKPIDNIWGRTIKVKLVQNIDDNATDFSPNPIFYPPEVDGQLELEYFERPEFMEHLTCAIQATGEGRSSNATFEILKRFESDSTHGPLKAILPDRLPNIPVYVNVTSVTHRRDINQEDVELVEVELDVWGDVDGPEG